MTTESHPTPKLYWIIAAILAVVTAVEIAIPQIDGLYGPVGVMLLLLLAATKFGLVVAFFMHLRFDKPLYRSLFLVGVVGVVPIFAVVLLTFAAF